MDLKIGHLTAPSSVNKAQTNRPKPRGIIIYRARTPDGGGCTDRATVRPAEEEGRPERCAANNGTGLDAPSV